MEIDGSRSEQRAAAARARGSAGGAGAGADNLGGRTVPRAKRGVGQGTARE
jgi:hypothetical protein